MVILSVNGTPLPAPHEYRVTLNDLDSAGTGRAEDGTLIRERIRGGLAKISVGWQALSTEECAQILSLTAPDSFAVDYFFGTVHNARMYAGARSAQLAAAREGQGVWNVSMELVEF